MTPQSPLMYQPELLNQDARQLARRHTFSYDKEQVVPVKPQLENAKQVLTEAFKLLSASVKQNREISPAAEWLIDNFYIIQEQIVQINNDFPIGFQRNIPHLSSGPNSGNPRVYDLVQKLALHTDNIVDIENLSRYTMSYQEESALKIGELWAIPIMVRLVLVQQLASKASRIIKRRKLRTEIQSLVTELQDQGTGEPGMILRRVIEWIDSHHGKNGRLVFVELAHQLQTSGLISEEEKRWFNFHLSSFGTTLQEALRDEAQRQSKLQVSIQNAIISMRKISEAEWQEFVEECSLADQILRLDPMGIYAKMDSKTKDRYRSTIERLSSRSDYTETEVAEKVLSLAEGSACKTDAKQRDILHDYTSLKTHVGYYLVGEGYGEICSSIKYRMASGEKIRRTMERTAAFYISFIAVHTFLMLAILWWVTGAGAYSAAVSISVLLVALFPALELSVSSVNRIFAFTIPPRVLPRMKIKHGIPDSARTIVVVPTLLAAKEDARSQLEKLEITSLANADPGLQYVLLSDFCDADREHKPADKVILKELENRIGELNKKYSSRYGNKFFVLHRNRKWNPSEQKWMGWERKRGKLEKLNQWLYNPSIEPPFAYVYGRFQESIQRTPVRYVLTLDADTRTHPDSVTELVEVASHPLNQPWYHKEKGRITKGYGIIQPRISIPPDAAHKTWFSRIFSGNVGIDPYTTAVSDIYQDLMGEAVYTGKGIYDVRAFHTVLDQQFPENRILSHDLIESNYLRAGLCTEIELFDEYPTNYVSFCKRNHRWTRGDWQIASWIFGSVPGMDGNKKNTLNVLSRWKIFDNLRRSLNPFFLTLFFITGWIWLPGSAFIWTMAAFGILAFPIYVSFSTDVLNRPERVKWRLYIEKVRSNLKINTIQAFSTLAILPHQALVRVDGILRSLWRLFVSRKKLLEWVAASHAEKMSTGTLGYYYRLMAVSVILGLGALAATFFITPEDLWVVIPFSLLWICSPYLAWKSSKLLERDKEALSEKEKAKLRTFARRTWFYFERLVTEKYSWLPPDNNQEDPPIPPVARTSPTNIGLTLVSTQVAYELGYITISELLSRLEHTLDSLAKLDRYKGHFYNWYEIYMGEVLSPKYISTVDSGNLAAGLIVVSQAVGQLWKKENPSGAFLEGLDDTLRTLLSILSGVREQAKEYEEVCRDVEICIERMLEKLDRDWPSTVSSRLAFLSELKDEACKLCGKNLMQLRSSLGDEAIEDLQYWLESPLRQIKNYKDELSQYTERHEELSEDKDELNLSPLNRWRNCQKEDLKNSEYTLLKRWKRQIQHIREVSDRLVSEMDFRFLYLRKRGLFSIGYNVEKAELDQGTYDLLASEARISSIIAIAKGDIPSEHWFRLGRRLTSHNGNEFLLSWGGTTFEYLMPKLFNRTYPYTLLSHTYQHIVEWQREYAQKYDRPWGFSESAYNTLNMDLHYQYRAFGVPGMGLKRGLAEEYVVAPYASALALMVDPKTAMHNLEELERLGAVGLKGYYDAVDFTPDHLNKSESYKVVKTYMAHHHGMSLIAFLNVLNGWPVHHYFHSDPRIKACELLLQERIPQGVPVKEPYPIEVEMEAGEQENKQYIIEHAGINKLDSTPPRVHLLSNGRFHSFIGHAGTGAAHYDDIRLTGWKADPTTDPLGTFVYIKDLESNNYWSAMHQPVRRTPDRYDTWFHNGKVQTSRVDNWIETTTEITISPEYPIELRKITLTNYSDHEKAIELTSYAEVVLNQAESHDSHPAFSKLFVQTEYLPEHHGLIAWRRPRSDDESPIYMVHTTAGNELVNLTEPLQFETERSLFIGRGRSLKKPLAMDRDHRLSGSIGNILDPVLSLRRIVKLKSGEKVQLSFGIGWAGSREEAVELADMFDNPLAVGRAFDLSMIYNSVELEHIGISGRRFHYFQKLAGYLLYDDPGLRADANIREQNQKKQSGLWSYGVSGDNPLVVFRINKSEQLKALNRLLKGHLLWKHRGLQVDLVILNDHPPSYADELQESIQHAVQTAQSSHKGEGEGEIFMLRSDRIPEEDLTLLLTVASIVFPGKLPHIEDMIGQRHTKSFENEDLNKEYQPAEISSEVSTGDTDRGEGLQYFNGYGGFSKDGREYHILISPDIESGLFNFPPAPWINVVANPDFGFLATESGGGYTWSENSRENKLTSWSNDPVLDPVPEAFYIRDEDKKVFWSPTPKPAPGQHTYRVIHGFGHTTYQHTSYDIASELLQFVPLDDSVKISRLTIQNNSTEKRRLSLFNYREWVLGIRREDSAPFIIQKAAQNGKVLYARNYYNNEFAERLAFASFSEPSDRHNESSFSTDRMIFIGRNRSMSNPEAVAGRLKLENDVQSGGDPCAVFQIQLELEPGEEIQCIALTGETPDEKEAKHLIAKYGVQEKVEEAFEEVTAFWEDRFGRIQVQTPDTAINLLMNGWLLYQNMVCRMWSRTGFYQAGGAYGFRDQLQDAMAALYVDPKITRKQILLHASRQFKEGDVQHWWHPPTGRGIRSKITDDRLWLPYVTHFYVESTGDESILDEEVAYLEARNLEEHEHEVYLQPHRLSGFKGKESLYEHCIRAINITLKTGSHGLPLIGTGDWNDGMNRVGYKGKGESVWLGFFLYTILKTFRKYSSKRGDERHAEQYMEEAENLRVHLNREGWDGDWFIRAFFDDGTPLGSAQNKECRIDAIAQAWAVISGAAKPKNEKKALEAVDRYLVSEEEGIIRLLTPPFDKTEKDPGYIKGYIPGVRENGGQYTHAALWVIKAFAEQGFGDKAVRYLDMINPVTHTATRERVAEYKVEPYVVAADVYGEPPLVGQGGWTWYTGSAGWMYRVILESILGIRLKEDSLFLQPAVSSHWDSFKLRWRLKDGHTVYEINIDNPDGLQTGGLVGTIDGEQVRFPDGRARVMLVEDHKIHSVFLKMKKE